MPISAEFSDRLALAVPLLAQCINSPVFIYDELGIRETHREICAAFGDWPYRQHFAIKALPNPAILEVLKGLSSGFDCSSPIELLFATNCGATGDDIVFTSNNTTQAELDIAMSCDARITFDDFRYFDRLASPPQVVTFRLAPGSDARSALMGTAIDSKFGMDPDSVQAAYAAAQARGIRRFGIYGMASANELDAEAAIVEAQRLVKVASQIETRLGIAFEYINFGGGIGIPYRPEEIPFDIIRYGAALVELVRDSFAGRQVPVLTELGRVITGPHGVLLTRVLSRTRKQREIVGVDANMAALVRPALYGAYHHITAPFSAGQKHDRADVVGSMCENGDRLARDRFMQLPDEGDLLYIHDCGAHAQAMGMVYNARLRPAEILLRADGRYELIRRAETVDDYIATVTRQILGELADDRQKVRTE